MAKIPFKIDADSGYVYRRNRRNTLVGHVSSLLPEQSKRGKEIRREWRKFIRHLGIRTQDRSAI